MLDRRYERMMSKKERRQFEKEKLKEMGWKQKAEYLWMYYKVWLLVPVLAVAAVYFGVHLYHGMTDEVLLQVMIVDGKAAEDGRLEQQFKDYIGAGKKNQTVRVNDSLGTATYQGELAFSTFIGAEAVDVVLCTEEFYQEEGEGVLEKCAQLENSGALKELLGEVPYTPVCVCIVGNAPNMENARQFVAMLEDAAQK